MFKYAKSYEDHKRGAWQDCYTYGGMPVAASLTSHEEKSRYLREPDVDLSVVEYNIRNARE